MTGIGKRRELMSYMDIDAAKYSYNGIIIITFYVIFRNSQTGYSLVSNYSPLLKEMN